MISVFLPFCFVLLMNGIEGMVDKLTFATWRQRLMKIAWDGCVLALGLVGGVVYNAEAFKSLSSSWPLIIVMLSIVIALSTAILILYWREANPPKGWKVLLSLALSGGVMAIPGYFALAR